MPTHRLDGREDPDARTATASLESALDRIWYIACSPDRGNIRSHATVLIGMLARNDVITALRGDISQEEGSRLKRRIQRIFERDSYIPNALQEELRRALSDRRVGLGFLISSFAAVREPR